MADIENNTPEFVKRDGIITDAKYVEWLGAIKQRYQRSQIKAAVQINHTVLEFYWELGRDIVALKAESQWGTGVLQQLSLDLRKIFPEEKGFSYRNIRYMRQWYSFYLQQVTNWHQASAKLSTRNWHHVGAENWQQPVAELQMPSKFALIPWKHHVTIVSKCASIDESFFYIIQTIANNWSRDELEHKIKSGLYKRQSAAINNFADTLALPQQQLAQEIIKSPYQFDFLNLKKNHERPIMRANRNLATQIPAGGGFGRPLDAA